MDLRVCHGVAGDNRFRISLLPGANADLRGRLRRVVNDENGLFEAAFSTPRPSPSIESTTDVTFISPQQAVRQIALAVLLCDV
jgi:hypothetical protein